IARGGTYWLGYNSDVRCVSLTVSGSPSHVMDTGYNGFSFPSSGSAFNGLVWMSFHLAGCGSLTIDAPIVTNGTGASNISSNFARLNGALSLTSSENATVHVCWGTSDNGTELANWAHDENLGLLAAGPFYANVSDLLPNTTYYYRCYALNSSGSNWAYTSTSFTTQSSSTSTVTNAMGATNITAQSAVLNGEVTSAGSENPAVHIYWGTSDGGDNAANWGHDVNLGVKATGAFTVPITGLSDNNTYYYRCYAHNSAGNAWSSRTSSFVAGRKLIGADDITPAGTPAANYFVLTRYTADYPGTLREIRVKCTNAGNVKIAIYSDNNSQPCNLLGSSENSTAVLAGLNTVRISPVQVVQGNAYWLAFISDASCVGSINSGGPTFVKAATYSSFTFPTSAGTGFNTNPAVSCLLTGSGTGVKSSSLLTETSSNESSLSETLLDRTITVNNVIVSGNLTGTFNITDFKMVGISTSSFANKGFFNASCQSNIEGVNYTGAWQGMYFKDDSVTPAKILLKGSSGGGMSGIIDGYLTESTAGNGIFNQYQLDLQLNQLGNKGTSAATHLNGSITYSSSQEHPSTQFYVLQTSASGTITGDYSGTLEADITHVSVADNTSQYYRHGFSVLSYTSDNTSGQGYTYDGISSSNQIALNGMSGSPLLGMLTGTIDGSTSPRTLSMDIEKIDALVTPAADLTLRIWSNERVSPGQPVTYTIEYRNEGLKSATDAVVYVDLPFVVQYLSASEGADYYPLVNQVVWDLGALPAQSSGYLTIQAQILPQLPNALSWQISTIIVDIVLHSSPDNLYLPGICTDDHRDPINNALTHIENAVMKVAYDGTTAFSGSMAVCAAKLGVNSASVDINGTGANGYLGNYNSVIAHSGGCMTAATQAKLAQGETPMLTADYMLLMSPQFFTKADALAIT
ncbi:MAG: hypothetical protein NTZ34_10150, partial [Chloroflexi bacterium]|nr:hypothetical protein [Chloroflexota bacterium]